MSMTWIYRVQDRSGRGPFRPGLSHRWSNQDKTVEDFPPWTTEFGLGILKGVIIGQHVGCGCRDLANLRCWFADDELERLYRFDYAVVRMDVERVLAESKCQLVFVRNAPLNWSVTPLDLTKEIL